MTRTAVPRLSGCSARTSEVHRTPLLRDRGATTSPGSVSTERTPTEHPDWWVPSFATVPVHRDQAISSVPEAGSPRALPWRPAEVAHSIFNHVDERATQEAGEPLPTKMRPQFEALLGADLSSVRIHAGPRSAVATSTLGARAYTRGSHIHFNCGEYQPDRQSGVDLLAHEVAHTAQNALTRSHSALSRRPELANAAAEREAREVARNLMAGRECAVRELLPAGLVAGELSPDYSHIQALLNSEGRSADDIGTILDMLGQLSDADLRDTVAEMTQDHTLGTLLAAVDEGTRARRSDVIARIEAARTESGSPASSEVTGSAPSGSVTVESPDEAAALADFIDSVSTSELVEAAHRHLATFMGSARARRFFESREGHSFESDIRSRMLGHLARMRDSRTIRQQLHDIAALPRSDRLPVLLALIMGSRESGHLLYSGEDIEDSYNNSGLDNLHAQQDEMRDAGVLDTEFDMSPSLASATAQRQPLISPETNRPVHPARIPGDRVLRAFAGQAGLAAARFREAASTVGYSDSEIDNLPPAARNFWLALSAAASGGNWISYRHVQMVAARDGFGYGATTLLEYMHDVAGLGLAEVTRVYDFEYTVTPDDRTELAADRQTETRAGVLASSLRVIHQTVNFRNQRTRSAAYLAAAVSAAEELSRAMPESEAEAALPREAPTETPDAAAAE